MSVVSTTRTSAQRLARRAEAALSEGRYDQAEQLFRKALETRGVIDGRNPGRTRSLSDQDELENAALLNNLAVVHKYQGRFEEASRLYRMVLPTLKRILGPNDCAMATLYHNLGGLEHARGRFARAEPFARRSVAIRKKILGADHPDVLADQAALAAILDGRGKKQEAERLFRHVLAGFARFSGAKGKGKGNEKEKEKHLEIAVNLNNLAAVCQSRGDEVQAERLYRRALSIKERVLGPKHPDTATTLNNLAVLRKSAGDLDEAESLYTRAIEILRNSLKPDHPNLTACAKNLAALRRNRMSHVRIDPENRRARNRSR